MAKVISQSQIEEAVASIDRGVKKSVIVSGSKDGPYSVMVVVVDDILPKAEVHEESADVWQVLKGDAVFIIGGELGNPTLHKPKERVADFIRGGTEYPVKPGDIIQVKIIDSDEHDLFGK